MWEKELVWERKSGCGKESECVGKRVSVWERK